MEGKPMMSETVNPHLVHTEQFEAEAERVAALLSGLGTDDWDRTVPTCPDWNVRKAVRHIGRAHRWTAAMVRSGDFVDPRTLDMGFPMSDDGYADWIRRGAADLAAAVREAGDDKPVWTWGPDKHARFWMRRMLHETSIHRADLELALDRTPAFDPAVAIDGVDEFLENLPSMAVLVPRIKELTGDGETLHLHATDVPAANGDSAEWLITLEPKGFRWRRAHAKGAAAVRGTVGDLYLFAWGRRTPEAPEVEVLGDHVLLDHWVKNASF